MNAKKSLGQHWLRDEPTLEAIHESAQLSKADTVLEIGPGHGDLTRRLVEKAGRVIAVELDAKLAAELSKELSADNLSVIQGDILKFDLTKLPKDYKVVANIPYYLTGNLLRTLSGTPNPPRKMVLLVQKEVAGRICSSPGQMSLLAVAVQLDYEASRGRIVPAELFTPPPKVDSQMVILDRRKEPLFADMNSDLYFRLVKAGFAGRRKKLRSSLAAGLHITKNDADNLLGKAGISSNSRAQELSLQDWYRLYKNFEKAII